MAERIPERPDGAVKPVRAEQQYTNPAMPPSGQFVTPGPEVPKIMSPPSPSPSSPSLYSSSLPPPGEARREEEKKRADSLEERAKALFGDIEAVDPEKIKPDNEILGPLMELPNMLAITESQPGKRYKWVYTGQNGYFITQARLMGWVPVQGKDPEAEDRTWTDSTRKLGDTVLMWIPEEKYRTLAMQDFQKRMLQQKSITAELEEMSERTGVPVLKGFRNRAMLERLQEQAFARQIAEAKFKRMIEQGRIPGMEFGEGK